MTPRRTELEAAYFATSYFVDAPGGRFGIRVGALSPQADALALEDRASTWAYVSAYNPGSIRASAEDNRRQACRLEQTVMSLGLRFLGGEGQGDDGAWPAEPSLLVLGVRLEDAVALARRFGQAAFVFGECGRPARLVWTDPQPE